MDTLDLEFSVYAACLTIAVCLYGIWRYAASNTLLGFSVAGLGPTTILGITSFAKAVVALQFLSLLILFVQILIQGKFRRLVSVLFGAPPIYCVMLLVVWAKIAADCSILGMDEFRTTAVKNAVFGVFLPTTIFLLAYVKDGLDTAFRDLLVGAMLFASAYLIPLAYPVLIEGRLISAALGEDRLTTYSQDTINGGRMFFLACLGFLLSSSTFCREGRSRIFFLSCGLLMLVCMLLNGTRQYVVAVGTATAIFLLISGRYRQLSSLVLTVIVLFGVYSIRDWYMRTQAGERFGQEFLSNELSEGRGLIWQDAYYSMLEHPLAGVGFRSFGEEFITIVPERGATSEKDNAHGFFQEVFVEHGLLIGTFLMIGWVLILKEFLRTKETADSDFLGYLGVMLLALAVTESFSGGVFNCLGFHLFAVAALVQRTERQDLARRNEERGRFTGIGRTVPSLCVNANKVS